MASSNTTLTNNSDSPDLVELEGKSQVYCGSTPVKKIYYGNKEIKSIYYGSKPLQ